LHRQAIRRPVLARWFDGSWHAWMRREKNPGSGQSSNGLAFGTVRPTQPWPSWEFVPRLGV